MIEKQQVLFKNLRSNFLDEILDFDYKSESHNFNKGVITAYDNLFRYSFKITPDYIQVFQNKRDKIYILNPNYDLKQIICKKIPLYLCESKIEGITIKKVKEEVYNLEELFNNSDKQIRRGIQDRKDIIFVEPIISEIEKIYKDWEQFKMNSPSVFRIAFNPKRYWRACLLKESGFSIYEKMILVNGKPYAIIVFYLDKDRAYELSFLSRYFDKSLRIINDLNEYILVHCMYDLWKNYGVKNVNTGVLISSKGLKFFKKQFKGQELIIYSS